MAKLANCAMPQSFSTPEELYHNSPHKFMLFYIEFKIKFKPQLDLTPPLPEVEARGPGSDHEDNRLRQRVSARGGGGLGGRGRGAARGSGRRLHPRAGQPPPDPADHRGHRPAFLPVTTAAYR